MERPADEPLPFRSRLEDYERQADELLGGHRAGDTEAIRIIHKNHPRFLDETITWRPKFMSSADIQKAPSISTTRGSRWLAGILCGLDGSQ